MQTVKKSDTLSSKSYKTRFTLSTMASVCTCEAESVQLCTTNNVRYIDHFYGDKIRIVMHADYLKRKEWEIKKIFGLLVSCLLEFRWSIFIYFIYLDNRTEPHKATKTLKNSPTVVRKQFKSVIEVVSRTFYKHNFLTIRRIKCWLWSCQLYYIRV
jgi:hypothetical protein